MHLKLVVDRQEDYKKLEKMIKRNGEITITHELPIKYDDISRKDINVCLFALNWYKDQIDNTDNITDVENVMDKLKKILKNSKRNGDI